MRAIQLNKKVTFDRKRAESLLLPIVAFLRMGGMVKEDIAKSFSSAYNRASKSLKNRQIRHIGHPTRYADVVGLWTRDGRFLNATGHPRPLSLDGKNGFAALVREISPESDALDVLTVLRRLGNVRRLRSGQYKLIKPLFLILNSRSMAFEPTAYFLSDASETLSRILTRTKRSRSPDVFWRKVENANLSTANANKFVDFTRERTFTFLEELDDWLEAHCEVKRKPARRGYHRVGLGLFSIHSKQESYK
jgi:hypothetical protein